MAGGSGGPSGPGVANLSLPGWTEKLRPRRRPPAPRGAGRRRRSPRPESTEPGSRGADEQPSPSCCPGGCASSWEARPAARVYRDGDPKRSGCSGEDPASSPGPIPRARTRVRFGGPAPRLRPPRPPPATGAPGPGGERGGWAPSRRRSAPWGPMRKSQTSDRRLALGPSAARPGRRRRRSLTLASTSSAAILATSVPRAGSPQRRVT